MESLKVLIEQKNVIEAKIESLKQNVIHENSKVLMEETLNLLEEVGEGFVAKDYYSNNRYYSKIPGVKNIRFTATDTLLIKLEKFTPLPLFITVRNVTFPIRTYKSKNYVRF